VVERDTSPEQRRRRQRDKDRSRWTVESRQLRKNKKRIIGPKLPLESNCWAQLSGPKETQGRNCPDTPFGSGERNGMKWKIYIYIYIYIF
jgi:hypothetical protein